MHDEIERVAQREAAALRKEFGAGAAVYAAMKAERAIRQKDFGRCATWKRVLELLASSEAEATRSS